jgi:hypothetical protein
MAAGGGGLALQLMGVIAATERGDYGCNMLDRSCN